MTIWGLALTAACLPLYVVRWRIGPLPTTLLETIILFTALAYLLTLWTERRRPAARTFLDLPIALLLIAGVIGIIVSPDLTRAAGIYRAYFLEAVAVFYIAVDMIRTREDLRRVLLVAGLGISLFAIGQLAVFGIAFNEHTLRLGKAPSFLNTSPNSVALFLEPPLAFALGFLLFPSKPRERWIALVFLAIILAATITTLSRASYVAMAALAVLVVLTIPSRRWRFIAIGVMATIALVILEVPFVSQRLNNLAKSVVNRESLYGQALHMLSQRPVFGAGISGFPVRVAPFRPPNQVVQLYPHDLWLTTWSELGLLGVLAFAFIFFSLLWRGLRRLGSAGGIAHPVLWGAVGALLLYLVHGFFDSPYWKNDLSVEFWLIAALEVIAIRGLAGMLGARSGS